jgi:hypothetical protein
LMGTDRFERLTFKVLDNEYPALFRSGNLDVDLRRS